MDKMNRTGLVLLGIAALVSLVTFFVALFDTPSGRAPSGSRADRTLRAKRTSTPARSEHAIRTESRLRRPAFSKTAGADQQSISNLLRSAAADDEMTKLVNESIGELLETLRNLSRGDDPAVRKVATAKLAELLGKLLDWAHHGVGGAKGKLVSVLGALGPDAIDLALQLVGDSDPIIAAQAKQTVFSTLRDASLGDAVRSEIVSAAAQELTDRQSLVRLYQEFQRMRNSVGVETIIGILSSGTEEARALLPQAMGAFTSDPGITTAEQLTEWLAKHPGNAEYDETYYGDKPQWRRTTAEK